MLDASMYHKWKSKSRRKLISCPHPQ